MTFDLGDFAIRKVELFEAGHGVIGSGSACCPPGTVMARICSVCRRHRWMFWPCKPTQTKLLVTPGVVAVPIAKVLVMSNFSSTSYA